MATCAKRVSIRLMGSCYCDELTDNSWELLDKISVKAMSSKGSRARNRKSDQALKPPFLFLFKDNGIVGRRAERIPAMFPIAVANRSSRRHDR